MRNRVFPILAAGLMFLVCEASGSSQDRPVAPVYANVEVISVDPLTRLVVIKGSKGPETFELDDDVSVPAGVKAGDHVMMTVRGEPGRKRIGAMTRVTPSPATTRVTTTTSSASRPALADLARVELREGYANQVAALSQQARSTDGLWSSFVIACDAKPGASAEGGREWFGLWDGRVKSDLSGGFCRDLFNQIVASGEGVKKAMAAAEDVARKTLDPGEMRDIRKLNSMDWDGWELPAPDRLDP
jgi:hypothetical protein